MKRFWCDVGGKTSVDSQAFRSPGNLQNINPRSSPEPQIFADLYPWRDEECRVRSEGAPGGSRGGVTDTDDLKRKKGPGWCDFLKKKKMWTIFNVFN